jgi:chromate transporter
MILLQLFWSFFQIGLFSIGGGYAALPLIEEQIVNIHHWLSVEEFTDVITISQMTPGPISINSATFVGIKIAGIQGAIIATLGCIFPSCVIVLTVGYFFQKYRNFKLVQGIMNGLRPAIVSLIASAGITILITTIWHTGEFSTKISDIDFISIILILVSFAIIRRWKINPIWVILGSGVVGLIAYSFL